MVAGADGVRPVSGGEVVDLFTRGRLSRGDRWEKSPPGACLDFGEASVHDMTDTTTEVALRDGGTVLLRPMAAADTDGVRALIETVARSDRPVDLAPSGDPRKAYTLVAVRGGRILGYAGYVGCGPTAARLSLAVAPGFRGLAWARFCSPSFRLVVIRRGLPGSPRRPPPTTSHCWICCGTAVFP